jgi:hypothetical protein
MRIPPRHLRAQRFPGMVIDYVLRQPTTDGSGLVQAAGMIMNYLTR